MTLVMAGAAAAMLLLAACDDEPTQEEAEEQFCDDVGALGAALGELRDVDNETSVEDFEAARESVRNAYDNVITSAQQLREVRLDDLQEANDNLRAAIDDIDDDASLDEALSSIDEEVEEVTLQLSQVLNDVNCGSGQGGQERSDE
jgi:hypothetical protein